MDEFLKIFFEDCSCNEVWRKMYNNEILSDVQFKNGEDEEIINAHCFLLALRSEVFKTQLYGSLKKSQEKNSTKILITITDFSWEAFTLLIKYIYKNDILLLMIQPTILLELLYGAKKYMLNDFKKQILDQINKNNKSLNDSLIYYLASFVHEEIAQEMHFQNSELKWRNILNDDNFFKASHTKLSKSINSLNNKKYPRALVFESIIKWVQYNVPEATKDGITAKELFEIMKSYQFDPYEYIKDFNRIDFEEVIVKKKLYNDEAHLYSLLLHILSFPRFFYNKLTKYKYNSTNFKLKSDGDVFNPIFSPIYIVGICFIENILNVIIEVFKDDTEIKMLNLEMNRLPDESSSTVYFPDIPFYPGYKCDIKFNHNKSSLELIWVDKLIQARYLGTELFGDHISLKIYYK